MIEINLKNNALGKGDNDLKLNSMAENQQRDNYEGCISLRILG